MIVDRPRYVLLPGLDGTGHYSEPLACALRPHGAVDVIGFPVDRPLGYRELVTWLQPRLPAEPFVLVAESFSGPLALAVARSRPAGLRGMVLGATFARLRHPARTVLRLGVPLVVPDRLPLWLATRALWGRHANRARREELAAALRRVIPEALELRALEALEVDARGGERIALPALILGGRHDCVVPPIAVRTLHAAIEAPEQAWLDTPHMLFQTRPVDAAVLIAGFVERRIR